jgi:exodeoxyribonuclease-3
MTILCYNLNGIRSALSKGLAEFLQQASADVLCFQELKAEPGQFDTALFADMGYHASWHPAEKKGYSGVAILSRRKPDRVVEGMGVPEYDREGRVLRADFGDLSVLSVYWPSGSSGDARQEVKMRFLDDFMQFQLALRRERPRVVISGDYNICHRPIDIHDPVSNKKSSGFLPEEREWMEAYFNTGMVDSFRYFYPDKPDSYTWWSFRAGARGKNKGWRIDYQAVSEPLAAQLRSAAILPEMVHSDHCPITVSLELEGW